MSIYEIYYRFSTPIPRAFDVARAVAKVFPDTYWDEDERILYDRTVWDAEQSKLKTKWQEEWNEKNQKVKDSIAFGICKFCAQKANDMKFHLKWAHHITDAELEMVTIPVVA